MSVWGQRSVLVFWGLCIVGSRVLSSCSDSSSLYSAGSGVKSVVIVLLALSFRSLSLSKSVRLLSMVEVFVVLWYSFCRMSRW